jgi:hypothetical protein
VRADRRLTLFRRLPWTWSRRNALASGEPFIARLAAVEMLAEVITAFRGVIEGDRYPHAPRLDPLRAALARLEAAADPKVGNLKPKAPPPPKADKRAGG